MSFLIPALVAVSAAVAAFLLAVHAGFRAPRRIERGSPAAFGLRYREVAIRTRGGKRLFAWWLPAGPGAPIAILLHGWGGNAEFMLPLGAPLRKAGFSLLLPDARSHGRSDGAGFSSLPRFAEDLEAALDWVRVQVPERSRPVVLLGHSVGAAAALLAASRRSDVAAVISIAAFAHPEWMMRRHLARLGIRGFPATWVVRYVELVIRHRYERIAPVNTACRARCPVLLVHGKADRTVPVTDAIALHEACADNPPELLLVDGAGHDSVHLVEDHAHQLLAFLSRAGVSAH